MEFIFTDERVNESGRNVESNEIVVTICIDVDVQLLICKIFFVEKLII